MRMTFSRAKEWVGVCIKDWFRYRHAIQSSGTDYLKICNRSEQLESAPAGNGYRCLWQWTSDLHAPKVVPPLGRSLMRRALSDHRVGMADDAKTAESDQPQVSFIIGHRGMSRLPHLLATIRSIAAQKGTAIECIVVEQDVVSQVGNHMPSWVKLVHTPPPSPDMPYCRAWTFNVGAKHARAAVLVLHDNDMLVPVDYAEQIVDRVAQGYDVVNLKRFIFYLTQPHTQAVFEGSAGLLEVAPEVIVQNLEGGGSVAITRAGYEQIGGLDESFVGWGGEDNEFWERAQTLRVWPWANLPLVHLWHTAQPGKRDAEYHTAQHYRALAQTDPIERIRRLRVADQGHPSGPRQCR